MYYAAMRKYDVANGTGIRSTFFVSGCTHGCKGCFNGEYQHFKYGSKWDEEAKNTFLTYALDKNVVGVTILGGEPMDQTSDGDLLDLLQELRQKVGKSIWLYSGYTYEQILADKKKATLLAWCDVLVDGRFEQSQKNLMLKFRGSENQRIIDVQASLAQGQVVKLENY